MYVEYVAYLHFSRSSFLFFTFPAHRITCRLGHYLSGKMINRPIGGQGKGLRSGGEGGCLATGCKWSLPFLAQHSNPGSSHLPLRGPSWKQLSHIQLQVRMGIVLSARVMSLFGPPSPAWARGREGFFVCVISGMMCMVFWHSYLSGRLQICRDTSRISCCWQSDFSCHKDLFDWWLPSFIVDIVEFSLWRSEDSCCLERYWPSITQISSVEKEWLGCYLVVVSSIIQAELELSVLIFLPKLPKRVKMNFQPINITKYLVFCTVTRLAGVNK